MIEFDELKNSLGDWCLQKQELIDQLPPLEVTEQQLLQQQQECSDLMEDIKVQSESLQKLEDLVGQFLRDTEVCGIAAE